jgi:hypothetical protein
MNPQKSPSTTSPTAEGSELVRNGGLASSYPTAAKGSFPYPHRTLAEIDAGGERPRLARKPPKWTPKEYAIAKILSDAKGQTVSFNELLAPLGRQVTPNALMMHIGNIRRKLPLMGKSDVIIQSVRGKGYRVCWAQAQHRRAA